MEVRSCNEFMEIRSYQKLKEELGNLYQRYSDEQLRDYYNNNYNNAPTFVYNYDNDENFKHTIILKIPGYKSFPKDKYGKFYGNKLANDIKITIQEGEEVKVLTHKAIIEDLYNKINESGDRKRAYDIFKNFLTLLHKEEALNLDDFLQQFDQRCRTEYQLPSLVSFIRWCAVQEMINYPRGWGRDLSFARYFEAIYAGFLGDEEMKNQIIECAKSTGTPLNLHSILNQYGIAHKIYNNVLNHRMK